MEYVLLVTASIWLADKAIDRLEIPLAYWRAKRLRPFSELSARGQARVLRLMRRSRARMPPGTIPGYVAIPGMALWVLLMLWMGINGGGADQIGP